MHLPLPLYLTGIAARTAIVLVALILGVHFFGKRGVGEMNLLDVLMILLIGNAVQNAITTGSGELSVGLASVVTLLAVDWLFGWLTSRNQKVQQFIAGDAVVIATDGKLDRKAMAKQGINDDLVNAAIREMGLHNLSEVRLAVLEDNGEISIIPKENK